MAEKRRKGGGNAASPPQLSTTRPSLSGSWVCLVLVNVLTVFVGVFVATSFYAAEDATVTLSAEDQTAVRLLGSKGALLFKSLDSNKDGNISHFEFGPIVEKLTGETPPVIHRQKETGETGEAVTLVTEFIPLVFESMKTYEDEGIDGMMRNYKALSGLRSWNTASMSELSFYSRDFKNFLPKAGDEEPGRVFWLYKPHLEPWYHGDSGKYYPPNPEPAEEILYKLMRMFHPRPFLLTRFGPYGSAAVVQGYNKHYYNIRFRIHCEFQMNEPPGLPFWLTPAQFTGNLVISRDGLRVKHFSLDLPADRKLNVDMEWITQLANEETGEKESMEVEIAYQPKMSIIMSGGESLNSFTWTKNITEQSAASALEKGFYPFKEVTYHSFEESFAHAAAEDKLVHSIVLWGSGRTLREGPLESSPVKRILKKYFSNTWVLIHSLKAAVNDSSMEDSMRHKYKATFDVYSFPVQCIIHHSNGTVIHHENLNAILFPDNQEELEEKFRADGLNYMKFGNLQNYMYAQFLTRGLSKASVAHDTQVPI